MTDEKMALRSYRKTPLAKSFARFMCLVTPTQRRKTSLQTQKRVAKARMITGLAVYDETPTWYSATPEA